MMIKSGSTYKCIAAATECSWHAGTQMEEASTKDDTNDWSKQTCVAKNWDCSVSALCVDDASGMSDADVLALLGTEVDLKFADTSGDQNRVPVSGKKALAGKAIVSDIQKNATNKQNQTWSAQFTGVGELKPES